MAQEIERKFLVVSEGWRDGITATQALSQAYLARTDSLSARVRIVDGRHAFLALKSSRPGPTRSEFEYAIPVADACDLMQLRQGRVIEKTRHIVEAGGSRWEVDIFGGELAGLAIAEIELARADDAFARPGWLGREVTDDPAYYNAALALGGMPAESGGAG